MVGTTSDSGSGVTFVTVPDLDAAAGRSAPEGGLTLRSSGGTWRTVYAWSAGAQIAGTHQVVVTDASGNSTTASFRLVADTTAPTLVVPRRGIVRGSVVRLMLADGTGAGATTKTVALRLRLGRHASVIRVVDRVGNTAFRRVTLNRVR